MTAAEDARKIKGTLNEVHVLTNKNFSEQKAEIAAQALELKELRATIADLKASLTAKDTVMDSTIARNTATIQAHEVRITRSENHDAESRQEPPPAA